MRFQAGIQVTLKPSVLDPQGVAVLHALGALGFDEASDVRVGKYITLQLTAKDEAAARTRVSAMCEALLANTVIEQYAFTLGEEHG